MGAHSAGRITEALAGGRRANLGTTERRGVNSSSGG
jgi:hypothetical protein